MNLLVLNGPNLNLLGIREPEIYGKRTYADLCDLILRHARERNVTVEIYQSNHEGDLIDRIQEARGRFDGILLNAGGYTHTSVAIFDALCAVQIPTVEVHVSDPDLREDFRHVNFIRDAAFATVKGKGLEGYAEAMDLLVTRLSR